MEKPNPDNYNSKGFYLDDLEKYNHMIPMNEKISKEEILKQEKYNWINGGSVCILTDSEIKLIRDAMEEYAAQFQQQSREQSKPVLGDEEIEKMAEQEFPYIKGNIEINTRMLLRRQDFVKGAKVIRDKAALSNQGGARWVKASEQLPENRIEDLPIKFLNGNEMRYEIAYCDENGKWFYRNESNDDNEYYPVGKIFEERICWLDEKLDEKLEKLI